MGHAGGVAGMCEALPVCGSKGWRMGMCEALPVTQSPKAVKALIEGLQDRLSVIAEG